MAASEESSSKVGQIDRYFQLTLLSADRLTEFHRLRYEVYVRELGFEKAHRLTDALETDEHDRYAVAAGLVYRPTGFLAAALRVVLPVPGARLPFRRVCFDDELWNSNFLPPAGTAELGRYVVAKSFRRRAGETRYADVAGLQPGASLQERRATPHITLGLLRGTLEVAALHGITHLVALLEPAYRNALTALGIDFRPFGPPIDFHGLRRPYWIEIADVLRGLKRRPDMFATLMAVEVHR